MSNLKKWKNFKCLKKEIKEEFQNWRKVPEEFRSNKKKIYKYIQAMMVVAQLFEQIGDESLIKLLIGNDKDNLLLQWQKEIQAAQNLVDNLEFGDAVILLNSMVHKYSNLTGTGADKLLPPTYGLLGCAHCHAGNTARGIEFTQKAQKACQDAGDKEGIATYKQNMKYIKENF